MAKLKQEKLFVIRAYCTECSKLLLESVPLSKKELLASWDKAVIDAPGIICKDCNSLVPNFRIRLKIFNKGSNLEYNPEKILPKPLSPIKSVEELFGINK